MFYIKFNGKVFVARKGDNLRQVLLKNSCLIHNGKAQFLNCMGLGTCGTCAVAIEGEVSQATDIEKFRLSFPPHKPDNKLRLACQCTILGNLSITKYGGFWGQNTDDVTE